MPSTLRFVAIALLSCLAAGCSTKSTYPVEGKVVFADGSPATELAGYTVSFDSAEQKVGANGVVGADGTFRIGTFEDDDGAMPGNYRVALTPPAPPVDEPPPATIIDKKYGDLDSSGLQAEIKPEDNVIELKVERLKK